MKKLTLAMIFMLTMMTPSFADFTVDDLFTSGGVDKPVKTKDTKKKEHDC
jgi:hypothetical protein